MKKGKRGREMKNKRWYQIAACGQNRGWGGGRSRTRGQLFDGQGVGGSLQG